MVAALTAIQSRVFKSRSEKFQWSLQCAELTATDDDLQKKEKDTNEIWEIPGHDYICMPSSARVVTLWPFFLKTQSIHFWIGQVESTIKNADGIVSSMKVNWLQEKKGIYDSTYSVALLRNARSVRSPWLRTILAEGF